MSHTARLVAFLVALGLVGVAAGAAWWSRGGSFLPGTAKVSERLSAVLAKAAPRVVEPGPLRVPGGAPGGALTRAGVVSWTNAARAREGRKPLTESAALHTAAERKLADMFARQYFAHKDPDGKGIDATVDGTGYAFLRVGENLALGDFASDETLVAAWMASPGHRENIMSLGYAELGVAVGSGQFEGRTTWLAVQVFALPASACPGVDPSLRRDAEEQRASLERDAAAITAAQERIERDRAAAQALADDINRLITDGNAKVEEGNREIEEGNRIARETGDREAAQPHWDRGAPLQAEGQRLHDEARRKQVELRELEAALTALVNETNERVDAYNRRRGGLAGLIERLNAQVRALNACVRSSGRG